MTRRTMRKLAVLVHADVIGSTRLVQLDEVIAHDRMQDAFRRFSAYIGSYGGITHELRGDALVAEFSRASDAVCAAIAFQLDNIHYNATLNDEIKTELRIGISLGEVVIAEGTVTGEGVIMAQRLEQLADTHGVVVQGAIAETVPTRLPFRFESLGEVQLKGFEQSTRAFVVQLAHGEQLPDPDPQSNLTSARGVKDTKTDTATIDQERDRPSVAVFAFDNLSNDPDQEFFSDGITEDIITELSRFRSLRVISRNSSFSYKGQSINVQEAARALSARYVVEGSVRKAGNRIRISTQLIDAHQGTHLWGERYERSLEDIFAVQDEISQTISAAISPEVGQNEQVRAQRKPTQSLNAWENYYRAYWHVHQFTLDDMLEAEKFFKRAISLDSEFGAAHTGLAYTLFQQILYESTDDSSSLLSQARSLARRGCILDDNDATAHFVMGRINVRMGELDLACGELEKAIQLNPSFASAYFGLGDALMHQFQFNESIKAFQTAVRLSPRDPHAWTYVYFQSWSFLGLKQYEEAISIARKALSYANVGYHAYLPMLSAMGHLGRTEEAKRDIRALHDKKPGYGLTQIRQLLDIGGEFRDSVLDGLKKAGLPE